MDDVTNVDCVYHGWNLPLKSAITGETTSGESGSESNHSGLQGNARLGIWGTKSPEAGAFIALILQYNKSGFVNKLLTIPV